MEKPTGDPFQLSEVKHAVQHIWYGYSEGYLPSVKGTFEDEYLYNVMDDMVPGPWTVNITKQGDVCASRPIYGAGTLRMLVVEKRCSGEELYYQVPIPQDYAL